MSDGDRRALDLVFTGVDGRTVLTRRRYRWPLLIGRVFDHAGVAEVTVQNAAGTIIPGDVVRHRIEVADAGVAAVRGQGATTVSGVPGGRVAVEETDVVVGACGRLLLDTSPRILTAHAEYRQHMRICVEPTGCAVLVDAMVLHPDLTGDEFGRYSSTVAVTAPSGVLLALDSQELESLPVFDSAPTAFATVYAIGTDQDMALTAASPELEALSVLTGDRRVYVAVADLPNGAGWAVRVAATDGGALRASIAAAAGIVRTAMVSAAAPSAVAS